MVLDINQGRRRREHRQPAEGMVALSTDSGVTVTARLVDTSACGCRVRMTEERLSSGQVLRMLRDTHEREVRVMWEGHKPGFEIGLMYQEAFLIDNLKAGKTELFLQLVSPYMRSLRLTVNSILRNPADVEEIEQESLLKALSHLHQFRQGQSFRPWLLQIATNEALKRLRKNSRYLPRPGEVEVSPEELLEEYADQRETPMEALERKEFIASVCIAVEAMDEMYRQVFVLRDLAQMAMVEVAAALRINVETANTRLHRARMQMRARLEAGRAYRAKSA